MTPIEIATYLLAAWLGAFVGVGVLLFFQTLANWEPKPDPTDEAGDAGIEPTRNTRRNRR